MRKIINNLITRLFNFFDNDNCDYTTHNENTGFNDFLNEYYLGEKGLMLSNPNPKEGFERLWE